ncbi:unnamed protein product, partial [Didymodactylos carnosus]
VTDPHVKQAYIRSDNAGCYHSAETILSIPQISKNTGITITRMDFSDPQGGKAACDRFAAVIKYHIRRYLRAIARKPRPITAEWPSIDVLETFPK